MGVHRTVEEEGNEFSRLVTQAVVRARQAGALEELPTAATAVLDHGLVFVIHRLAHLRDKPRGGVQAQHSGNPFLPYDPAMFVTDVPPHHVCLLNKFYVIARHLLVITRDFESQESLLTLEDFRAWWYCLSRFSSLGFYNSGTTAGASQLHKHMQLLPWPSFHTQQGKLLTDLYAGAANPAGVIRIAALPFEHALSSWDPAATQDVHAWPCQLQVIYRQLLAAVHVVPLTDAPSGPVAPYNLLLTTRWMLAVPRRQESAYGISVNGLGYAGSLLAMDDEQLETIRAVGPLRLLRDVGFPNPYSDQTT